MNKKLSKAIDEALKNASWLSLCRKKFRSEKERDDHTKKCSVCLSIKENE
jgi:hypothetical protein